jgi:hypothetical protein
MNGIERNRMNYDFAARVNRDSVLSEEWKRLNGDIKGKNAPDTMLQSKKSPLQEQQEKLLQMQQMVKANKIKKITPMNAIDAINNIDSVNTIDTDMALSHSLNFQDAGRFDLKQDIVSFIRPKALASENFKKEVLNKTGHSIISHLELSGASEALIKRAKSLLEEENTVKSVTDAYRNALIFS